MNFEIDYIKQLAKLVDENSLSELILENGDTAICIKKGGEVVHVAPAAAPAAMHAPATVPPHGSMLPAETATAPAAPKGTPVTSPMVGAFYAAPSPGAKPFVRVGDKITVGQVVCIVEAMKMMNQIESEVGGTVVQICVEDGQSVEYGQVLMYVE
ncbi:acetyl-CoA carboxylase biotin carboxyl carrier protein [Candidatus Gastranaerophilus sp. (ex Termes propinquus)]|nr:acetyl-CoA carboxylase biotin carboxyl carrier protein [Candidatus Gastranaerophilus sp. (ex Termes propinquus)]